MEDLIENREAFRFLALAGELAEKNHYASVDGPGAEPFQRQLYADWSSAGKPSQRKWLGERLAKAFVWVKSPPVWIEDHCPWPFLDHGTPMVFVAQLSMEPSPVTEALLAYDYEVYLFAARSPLAAYPGKFEIVHRIVTQYRD